MKTRDIQKAKAIVDELDQTNRILSMLDSDETLSISIGDTRVFLTPRFNSHLRGVLTEELVGRARDCEQRLTELGVEV